MEVEEMYSFVMVIYRGGEVRSYNLDWDPFVFQIPSFWK